ncbi:unnamed protein product [Rhizophagus irregularis]|uniref:WD40 repeat-like protein n=1 Tax=Rhizophagus irregularis TaxID=588596 RepID=A0A2I1G0Q7_9GLOM|nr:hypothetical protein RhiirA4_415686 [Rhizophagus irregularis]CAB4406891.1 unnamed protein product [Rhizophagus irregularis]
MSTEQTHEISKIAVSPKGNYVVTYSKKDKSIFGWNIEEEDSLIEIGIKDDEELHPSKEEIYAKDEDSFKNDSLIEDSLISLEGSHRLVFKEEPSVANLDAALEPKEEVLDMMVSDYKMLALYCNDPLIKIYKFGEITPIKIDFKQSGGKIRFDGKQLVYCKLNQILIYSLNNTNKLKLESIYRIDSDSVINECGITDNIIWARSPYYLHLWNLHSFQKSSYYWNFFARLPERNYYLANIDSLIRLNINNKLILTRDNRQNVIFSRKFNTPIRYFKDEKSEILSILLANDYLLVHSANNKLLLYNIFDEDNQPLDLCFEKIKKTYDYNLQSNKIYGMYDNKIVTYNLNKIEWKKCFKLEEDGWRNYLEDDIDINDTIIDP